MSVETPEGSDLSVVLRHMSGLLLSQETLSSALRLVVDVAREVIPESSGAGVTLIDHRGRRTTAAATDETVESADKLQYDLDEGPCLTAWADQTMVLVDDTATTIAFLDGIPLPTRWGCVPASVCRWWRLTWPWGR